MGATLGSGRADRPDGLKPRWWKVLRMRMRSLFRRERVDQELDRELRFHLEQQVEENLAAGMPLEQARFAASRRLGGVTQIQEECRDMRRTEYIENLAQDLRYAIRTMARTPVFTVIIVATLALAIGANSAIFSVIDGVLLRPLPYPDADRLVRVFHSSATYPRFPLNPWDFRDLRARNRSFDGLAAYSRADLQLSGLGRPVKLAGFRVTAAYFRVLGLQPARGREFDFNDELPGNGRVVILSDRVWRGQFNAAADIVGRTIMLDSRPFTVAGVMPPGVDHPGNRYNSVAYGDTVDFWWPFTFEGNPRNRGSHFIEGIARLKPGVSAQQAQSDLDAVVDQIKHELPGQNWHPAVDPLYGEIVGPVHQMLLLLLGAVGLVLLIACANTANLLLARAAARQREMAVRTALGARRSRLVRQMFAESLLIAVTAGGLGALLAAGGVQMLVAMLPPGFPRASAIHVNAGVLGFTLLIALATGVLFGLAPALQASRSDPQSGLREGGRGSSGGRRHARLRSGLVVAEVALSCVLLIGAGLLLRSFFNMMRAEPGFHPEHLLTATISLPRQQYQKGAGMIDFYNRLAQDLGSTPGTQAVGIGSDLPWTGYDDNLGGFNIEGKPAEVNQKTTARYHLANGAYFQAMGIPLKSGRFFDGRDNPRERKDARQVIIINEVMARRYWPGEDAVGKRITFDDKPKDADWMTVAGVVGDIKDGPADASAKPALWWPLDQMPMFFGTMSVAIRSDAGAAATANRLRQAVQRLDPNLAVADIRQMDQIARNGFSTPRFSLFLVGLFAGLALCLAAIGIYGVIAYSVSQRTHEFGLRMALGAGAGSVMRLVMGQGIRLALIGVGLGLVAAVALGRLLGSFLYGVGSADPLTLGAVAVAAIVTAVAACYPPARRATAADPISSLRAE